MRPDLARVHDLLGDGVEHLMQEIREAAQGMDYHDRDSIAGGVRSAIEHMDFEKLEICIGELREMGAVIQHRIITMPCDDRHYVYRMVACAPEHLEVSNRGSGGE